MQTATRGSSGFGKLLGIATLGALFWFTRSKKPSPKGDDHSAAFADGETHPENFDQTRAPPVRMACATRHAANGRQSIRRQMNPFLPVIRRRLTDRVT